MTYEIKNLESLLLPALGKSEFVSASVNKLTSAGDNYCSLILAVDVTARDGEKLKQVRTVAKLLPQNEYLQKLFNSKKTFRNELGFYDTIAPCLRQFQKEQGLSQLLSSFPDFFCARLTLDPANAEIDDDAVLLIKNIKDEGFTLVDRRIGFDLAQSKLVLEKMAELHATTLALKLLKPEIFDEKLKPFFGEFGMYEGDAKQRDDIVESIVNLVKDDEFCDQNLDRVRQVLHVNALNCSKKNNKALQKSVFTSFAHIDMWTNNIMVKIVDHKTVDVKFLDYQIYEYSSLTRDVVFYLYSSVQTNVVKRHCDHLLGYYYDCFIKYLKALKCDISPFSFEGFLEDMKAMVGQIEFFHVMLMLKTTFAVDENTKEVEDVDADHFSSNTSSEACKEKARFIVREFINREWI